MIHDTTYVGIDVSKMQFDVHIHPGAQSLRCGTSPEEIARLVQRLARLGPVAVGLEASGGYEGRLADSLHAAGLEVYVVAPARVRNFARAIGQLAKTDRIDAAMIARYLMAVRADLTPHAPDPVRRRLRALSAHRRRLVAERSGLVSQLDTIDEPLVRDLIETRLMTIGDDIAMLEAAIADLLAGTPALRRCHVGDVAQVLSATGTSAIAVGFAGLARIGRNTDKGGGNLGGDLSQFQHVGQQGGGQDRADAGDAAKPGMAVLSAIKVKDPILGGFYQRLRARGKPFKLAMIATVRKLITILNAIARTQPGFA